MTVVLSEAAEARLREIIASYPQAKSAVMPALFIAQEELGWVSDEAIEWVAQRTGAAPAHVRSVASFYTMYYKRPVGKYHIQLCRTLSCAVCGGKELLSCLR
ncbi:MAG TPA: NAD(P)H-dependent oxidoreductase subunit E, partial [Oligoflexia bacterium]|nr:NAD(P)H-dependent oxidoreductase subunit E [Oligoflexia bacterium]